jgi:Photosynthesis system II assembly factor YCF48
MSHGMFPTERLMRAARRAWRRTVVGLVCTGVASTAGAVAIKDNLYGVKAMSPSDAVAVGNAGSIYRTTDGGGTWEARVSGVEEPLFSVDFSDGKNGWAVGKSAAIVHTSDGGATWKPQTSPIPPDKHLFKVAAVDARTAWAVGDWGAITVTTDGGATWKDRSLGVITVKQEVTPGRQMQTISDDIILYDIQFVDPQHGVLVGEFGTLMVTADAGQTWEKRETQTEKTLFGVGFATIDLGWAVGMDGLVIRTKDGGKTWERQRGREEGQALDDVGFLDTIKNPGLYAVNVIGRQGVVAGDTGVLLTTADGGDSWVQLELPAKQRLTWMRAVSVLPGGDGFVVGANGFLARVERGKVRLPEEKRASAPAQAAH